MWTRIAAGAASLILLLAGQARAEAPPPPSTPEAWQAAYRTDLDFLRDTLKANHPGALDPVNGKFAAWLDKGYAVAAARPVRDGVAYRYAMVAFVQGFGDSHTSLYVQSKAPPLSWPGFMVGRMAAGDQVILRDETDPEAPALGSRILSCDGAKLDRLTSERVFPFRYDARVPEHRRYAVTSLFLSRGNPFSKLVTACKVQAPGEKKVRTLKLRWRQVDDEKPINTAYSRQLYGQPSYEFALTEPAPGVVWLRLPSFDPSGDAETQLKSAIEALNKDADRFRAGKLIVLDTRGNGGGNSMWGGQIARALWSQEALDQYLPQTNTWVDWRASRGNLDYMNSIKPDLERQFGPGSQAMAWITDLTDGLAGALAKGEAFWRDGEAKPPTGPAPRAADRPKGPGLFPAKVVLLTDGGCASACLDFADRVLHMPGVVFAGAATSGDGLYMDGREIEVPSGQASLFMAQKVYRGRLRGDMEVYRPDLPWAVDWRDETAVQAWVLSLAAP
jgi:hypothetical protein